MALRKGLPAKKAATDSDDTRYDWRNFVVCNSDGTPRGGVTSPVGVALVTATATMNVAVVVHNAVEVRDNGVVTLAVDAVTNVLLDAAPSSNSRLDVIVEKQNDSSTTVSVPDANDLPVLTFIKGASTLPLTKPTVPAGYVELATVQIPSGATATNSGGVIITQTAQFTAAPGGAVPFRTVTDLNLWTNPVSSQYASVFADPGSGTNGLYVYRGGAWVQELGDTGWIAATLQSSWVNFGGAYQIARYRRKNGLVWGQAGRITSGIAGVNPVWTLPVGMRPSAFLVVPQWGNGGANAVEIGPDGRILPGDTGLTNLRQSIIFSFPADG